MRPLTSTYMGCFVGRVCLCEVARLATHAKFMVMSGPCCDVVVVGVAVVVISNVSHGLKEYYVVHASEGSF